MKRKQNKLKTTLKAKIKEINLSLQHRTVCQLCKQFGELRKIMGKVYILEIVGSTFVWYFIYLLFKIKMFDIILGCH